MTQPAATPAAPFSTLDATSLFSLATIVNYPLGTAPVIDPFQLIGVLQKGAFTATAQGLVGFGTLLSTGATVAVVVMGWQWQLFLTNYLSAYHVLAALPFDYPNKPAQPPPQFDYGYENQYMLFRNSIWTLIQRAKSTVQQFQTQMPLITTGYGPSAPLAQLAALDLQPGNSYNGNPSPITSVACYAYSCPAGGDAQFSASYAQCVPATYMVNLATGANAPVDLYPTVSGPPGVYKQTGTAQGLGQPVPSFVCPWLEREWFNYGNSLNAAEAESEGLQPPVPPVIPPGADTSSIVPANPPGYQPTLAYTLTLLCSAVYSYYEHPGLNTSLPQPYSWAQNFTDSNNTIWASLFYAPGQIVVAFRGPDTWAETNALFGNQTLSLDQGYSGVLAPFASLYEQLRTGIRSAIQQIGTSSQTVTFTGHCGGGGLASLALYDMVTAPIGKLPAGGVYTFGAPPLGDTGFASTYASMCGSKSYQLARPLDVVPKLLANNYRTVATAISLNGGLADTRDCFTYHTLAVYSALLNQYTLAVRGGENKVMDKHYQQALASRGIPWNEVTKCVLDTSSNQGSIVLSWAKNRSYVEPSRYGADGTGFLGLMDVVVQPGHELVIEAPHQQGMQVVARTLTMGAGSRLTVKTGGKLSVTELRGAAAGSAAASNPPEIFVVGVPGAPGWPGPDGSAGANGGEGMPGGNGGYGAPGGQGSNGGDCPSASFLVQTISGLFRVTSYGGAGGAGGNGGAGGAGGMGGWMGGGQMAAGGNGGMGGDGGAGGNGGAGGTVTIVYDTIEPGGQIVVNTPASTGGAGGAGGTGGSGGGGNPAGLPGQAGNTGLAGCPGVPSVVILQQRVQDNSPAAVAAKA